MVSQEEYELLKPINEIRRNLLAEMKKWEKSNTPAFVNQEDVNELKKITKEFEDRFREYEKAKEVREEKTRVKAYTINPDSAKYLNEIYLELGIADGALEPEYDYEEDPYNSLKHMNEFLSVPNLVHNMEAFIRLAKSK